MYHLWLEGLRLATYCNSAMMNSYKKPNHSAGFKISEKLIQLTIETILTYPPVNKHSYGKSPFVVDLPIENGDFPYSYASHYQRVNDINMRGKTTKNRR